MDLAEKNVLKMKLLGFGGFSEGEKCRALCRALDLGGCNFHRINSYYS